MPDASYQPGKPSDELRHFTNRKPEMEWFLEYLNAPRDRFTRLPALMLYGVGGIGKSWLQKHLKNQLGGTWRGVASVRIDFTKEGRSNRIRDDFTEALADIRDITEEPCPRFDLAYAFLQVHRGVRDESALENPNRRTAFGVANEIVKGGIGLVPVVGPHLQIGYSVLEKLYPKIQSRLGWDRVAESLLQDIATLRSEEPGEIEKSLVWRLAQDLLTDGVLQPHSSHHAVQAVIFVDTLEALEPIGTSTSGLELRTRWLRDLICELNGRVLFVLAGQNRLDWETLHPDWGDASWLEQRLVGGLHEKDAGDYLARCGIHEVEARKAMLAVCLKSEEGYHSLHLGLLADLAWLERKNGQPVVPALFASLPPGDWSALALRFLKSLAEQSDADWIRKLAWTPEFDEAAARAAYSQGWSQAQDTDWHMLRQFSFLVSLPDRPGWWTIHSAMQRAIEEDLARRADGCEALHRWWSEYWRGRTADSRSVEAPLAWYHRWRLDKRGALSEWNGLAEAARSMSPVVDMAFHYRLLSWWKPVRLLEQQKWTELDARAANGLALELGRASIGDRAANLREAIACYRRALEVYTREELPQGWAATQNNLGTAWWALPDGDRAANLREAIAGYGRALEVYTREAFPQDWAMTQNNLGVAWGNLPDGDRAANLREAIACYFRALEVRTREAFPQNWAMTQNNLGVAWGNLPDGHRAANLREAIASYGRALEVRTREAFPHDWGSTQNNLGIAWGDLPEGDRSSNLREAIACYRRALEVHTREAFPQDWAGTQNNLGTAWRNLPDGDRAANLREAVACYRCALEVYTREAFPQNWAATQNNLGIAWWALPDGDWAANLREAIACFRSALEVRTRKAFPQDWAMTQNNLGNAWRDLPEGDRAANLREANACYCRALEVYTREAFPQGWAATKNNLGTAWRDLPEGDRAANLREAIACYRRALEVRTREAFPQDWAMTQNNLGIAWRNLPDGDRAANLREAIVCYRRALEVYTREAFPQDWAMTQNNLGIAWRNLPDGDRAANLREAIVCYRRALEVYTREAFPQDWATTQNNLGIALGNLTEGDRAANLREAIACYRRAVEVYTREAFPQDWAMTQYNLGIAWGDLPEGDRAANLREAIACYRRALEVYTREAFPRDWADTQNNLETAQDLLKKLLPPDSHGSSSVTD